LSAMVILIAAFVSNDSVSLSWVGHLPGRGKVIL
jgi:hypothetical protein